MALTKSDIQELLTASEERLGSKIASIEERLGQNIKTATDSLEERVNGKIEGAEKQINDRINSVEKQIGKRVNSVNERIGSVEKQLGNKINSVNDRIDTVETQLRQEIKSSADALEQKLSEKIASESKILQILFGHVLKNQETLQAFISERLTGTDKTITTITEEHQELCEDLVELQTDVEQLKIRVFGVK